MNNQNHRPLQQRATELRDWLKGRLVAIQRARKERATAFKAIDSAVHTLDVERSEIEAEIKQAQQSILEKQAEISSLQDTIQSHQEMVGAVATVILAHKNRLILLRKQWVDQMRVFQDGKVRRKRVDLVKVDRRIQAKIGRAEKAALLKEPLTAIEIGVGVTFEEKLARQQAEDQGNDSSQI